MTTTALNERIASAKERISKKQATIEKKRGWIEKKRAALPGMTDSDRRWAECDIECWEDDIERSEREIVEITATIEKYEKQLAGATAEDDIFRNEIPGMMKEMQTELVERWDRYDTERREEMRAFYKAFGYTEFRKRYTTRADYEFIYKTDEQIHKANEADARALILDLYRRIKHITGEITDWHHVEATIGAHGMTVLNGYVIGKQGRCEVESILAGGYNIQRLHMRVLTREFI